MNIVKYHQGLVLIELTGSNSDGRVAIVEEESFSNLIKNANWRYDEQSGVAVAVINGKLEKLHRMIVGTTSRSTVVEFEDGNKMNCTFGNLKVSTRKEYQERKMKEGKLEIENSEYRKKNSERGVEEARKNSKEDWSW